MFMILNIILRKARFGHLHPVQVPIRRNTIFIIAANGATNQSTSLSLCIWTAKLLSLISKFHFTGFNKQFSFQFMCNNQDVSSSTYNIQQVKRLDKTQLIIGAFAQLICYGSSDWSTVWVLLLPEAL